jgi:hypothetical protein
MFLVYEHKFFSFKNFLLSESIKPKEVDFGINDLLNDRKWITTHSNEDSLQYTFLQINSVYYMVMIQSDGEVMFGASDQLDIYNIYDIDYLGKVFTDDRRYTKKTLTVFGNIIYVLLEGLKYSSLHTIKFNAANAALSSAYNFMMKNKFLIDVLKENGWKYIGLIDDEYIFKNKQYKMKGTYNGNQ